MAWQKKTTIKSESLKYFVFVSVFPNCLFPPEDDTRAGQPVNVGGDGLLVPVAAQAGLQIVHHDQQDVWRLRATKREEETESVEDNVGRHVV